MEKLEMLKQKLSKKRKLAVACLLGSVPVSAVMSVVGKAVATEAIKQSNLIKYQEILNGNLLAVIIPNEPRYITPFGVNIPRDPNTYLQNIEANKAAFGEHYDLIYGMYYDTFEFVRNDVMYMGNVQEQAMQIGVGVGVVSFLLVAGIPTARCLLCKRKIKKLEKELGENKEIEMSA